MDAQSLLVADQAAYNYVTEEMSHFGMLTLI